MFFKRIMNDREVLISIVELNVSPHRMVRRSVTAGSGYLASPSLQEPACMKTRTQGAHFGAHFDNGRVRHDLHRNDHAVAKKPSEEDEYDAHDAHSIPSNQVR